MMSLFRWRSRPAPVENVLLGPPPAAAPAGGDAWDALRGPVPPKPPAPPPAPQPQGVAPPVAELPPPEPAPPPPPPLPPPELRRRQGATIGQLRIGAPVTSLAYAGPNRIEAYRDIVAVSDLGTLPEPHRLTLHGKLASAPPSPLFEAEHLPDRIRNEHRQRPMAPAVEIYAVPGQELGAAGLLQQNGRVFVNTAVLPGYISGALKPDTHALPDIWAGSLLKPDAEIIETDGPVGLALHPNLVYGHFLLEMLPRLHLLSKLRGFGRPFPIAVPNDCSKWVRAFVSLYFEDSEIIYYNSKTQRLRAPCFVLPSMMMENYGFHPELNTAVDELIGRVVGPYEPASDMPRRIYLSRSRLHRSNATWRSIVNEAEVESTLTDLGFTVIYPEEVPLPRQLALYAAAECVVSEYSSALHNTLFAPRGCAVFSISWLNNCQSRIAALRGQPLAFMAPSDHGFLDPAKPRAERDFRFQVDCVDLARRLAAFMAFSAAQREGGGQ